MTNGRKQPLSEVLRVPRVTNRSGRRVPLIRRSTAENVLACPTWSRANSEAAAFGQLVHEGIAVYLQTLKHYSEDTRIRDVDRIARSTFHRTPRGIPLDRLDEYRDLLEKYARSLPVWHGTLLRVEHQLRHDIGWAVLSGQFDVEERIDSDDVDDPISAIRLTDHKASWDTAPNHFQMRWYTCLAFLEPGREALEHVEFRTVALRGNADPWEEEWSRWDFEHGELGDWWENDVLQPLAELWPKRRQLGPHGGPACQYCAKRLTCGSSVPPASIAPRDSTEAEEFFQDLLRLDALVEERRKALWQFFSDRDPQVLAGHDVGYLESRDARPKVSVAEGRDEEVITFMNTMQPGAGDMVRRRGVWPDLIHRDWWPVMEQQGLLEIEQPKRKPHWRRHIEHRPEPAEAAE
jgi:hypothetical protein